MKKESRGFTLIELIVVFAILSIVLSIVAVGIPAYQRFIDKSQLKNETRAILQSILKARTEAIMDGYTRRIYINDQSGRIYIKRLYYPGDPPAEYRDLAPGIKITSNTYLGNLNLDLKPIGTVNVGGHITLRSPKGQYMTIVVQIGTGRIYMKEGMIDD